MRFSCKKLVLEILLSLGFMPLLPSFAQQMGHHSFYSWSAILSTPPNSKIVWSETKVTVIDKGIYHETELEGDLPAGSSELRMNGNEVPLSLRRHFQILLGFQGMEKAFVLSYRKESGEQIEEHFELSPEEKLKSDQMKVSSNHAPASDSFHLAAGVTFIDFEETASSDIKERVLTVSLGYQKKISPEHWSLGASTFYNAAIFENTNPTYAIQVFGLDGGLTYQFLPENHDVQFSLTGGLYYTTSFGKIGFTNVVGPQLYPAFKFFVGHASSINIYGKFSPVQSIGASSNFSQNHEVSSGISYATQFWKQNVFFGYDFSKLSLEQNNIKASSTTSTLSIGLGF